MLVVLPYHFGHGNGSHSVSATSSSKMRKRVPSRTTCSGDRFTNGSSTGALTVVKESPSRNRKNRPCETPARLCL